jgi:DNA-binding response OmpR family regulator
MNTPPLLLIVDDDADFRRMLEMHFTAKGFQVVTAPTGNEGLEKALALKPDIVLLDMGLPDIGGLRVLLDLRGSETDFRVIMITANGDGALAKEALITGANDYLAKPFRLKTLDTEVGFQLSAGSGQPPPGGTTSFDRSAKREKHPAARKPAHS